MITGYRTEITGGEYGKRLFSADPRLVLAQLNGIKLLRIGTVIAPKTVNIDNRLFTSHKEWNSDREMGCLLRLAGR